MTDFDKGYYPPVSFYFQLSFSGKEEGGKIGFKEVSGISMEMNTEDIAEGGENRLEHRLPTVTKYTNLIMKRGLAPVDSIVITWIRDTLESNLSEPISPKNITVSLLDSDMKPLMIWNFINAYPVKWEVSNFKSKENEVAIEALEFAYNYFEQKSK